jgi:hypothetical protein
MKKEMNIFRYVTYSNPDAARNLLLANGFDNVPKNYEEVSRLLAQYYVQNKEDGLKNILLIHPDYEVIKSLCKNKSVTGIKEENGDFLSCAGCPMMKAKLSADAAQPENKGMSEKLTNALIIGGSVVLATVLGAIIITSVRNMQIYKS